jgi:hypothetical protein
MLVKNQSGLCWNALCALMPIISAQALATTSSTDYSDQWFNPAESGWGASVLQQQHVIFVDLFVYGDDDKPTWFVAAGYAPVGVDIFVGDLYSTTGPSFSLPTFDPTKVVGQKVGTLTFAAHSSTSATLSYNVGAASVTKEITRQTWATNQISGTYIGGLPGRLSNCGLMSGRKVESGTIQVAQTDTQLTIMSDTNVRTCSFTGDYMQFGRMAKSTGTFHCDELGIGALDGTYTLDEIEASVSGMTMKLHQAYRSGCEYDGRIGGVLQ